MGRIDNEKLTLQGFVDRYINLKKDLRILTGCVSAGPLRWLLKRLPQSSKVSIITGSIAPDLQQQLDTIFLDSSQGRTIGHALKTGRFRLGWNPEIHMKIWLFKLEVARGRPYLTVWGSSNLTKQGLGNRRGEQNDYSRGYRRFAREESRWNRFEPETTWLTCRNWTTVRDKCWKTAAPSFQQKETNLEFSKQTLKDIIGGEKKHLVIETIQQIVAKFFGMSVENLKSKKRTQELALARQIAIYLARELTSASYTEIGIKFGNKDHTTILYAYKKIKEEIKNNTRLEETLKALRNVLRNYGF